MSDSALAARTREFKFRQRDFAQVRRLIAELAGINLAPSKHEMVYNRLSRRLRARGMSGFDEYLASLQNDPQELECFVNSLTTNLTAFFREQDHFTILADFARTRKSISSLRVWCAASSTGEEAYSIALALASVYGEQTHRFSVMASDLDSEVLEVGRRAIYPIAATEKMPAELVRRFFLRGKGAQDGYVKLRPEIRGLVSFRRHNLLDKVWDVGQPFDVIFCRNVLIYFSKETQHRVLGHIRASLRADGLLFTGKSESLMHDTGLFRPLGRCVYRRAPDAPAQK